MPAGQQVVHRKGKRERGDGARTGCQVHFTVVIYVALAATAVITYYAPSEHVDEAGLVCHGLACEAAKDTHHATYLRVSADTKEVVQRQLRLCVTPEQILRDLRGDIKRKYLQVHGPVNSEEALVSGLQRHMPDLFRFIQRRFALGYYNTLGTLANCFV